MLSSCIHKVLLCENIPLIICKFNVQSALLLVIHKSLFAGPHAPDHGAGQGHRGRRDHETSLRRVRQGDERQRVSCSRRQSAGQTTAACGAPQLRTNCCTPESGISFKSW